MSLDDLVATMGGIVTKQALSKYERGMMNPSATVLNRIASALGVKSAYLWGEPTCRVEFISYRKRSRLGKREQESVQAFVATILEERVRFQDKIGQINGSQLPVQSLKVSSPNEAESAAEKLRAMWQLGINPFADLTSILEDHFIHVLEIDTDERFDGISAVARGEDGHVLAAAVVTRRGLPGDRQRLRLAHELGHLVLDIPETVDNEEEEKLAFRFGTAFLVSASQLIREVGPKRNFIRPEELLFLKRRYEISIQAILCRLKDLDIITESYYEQWCRHINQLGWKKKEPYEIPPERPERFQQLVLRSFSEGLIAKEEAERLLGGSIKESPIRSLIERRAFLKLPLEERRRLLAEQAEKMEAFYEQDSEWRELGGGDLVES